MEEKGIGQYDLEYKNCPCFWGNEPGKFVKKGLQYMHGKEVLDIGAGEGKNSIFLAKAGFYIDAVEVSEYAINNFNEVLKGLEVGLRSKINIIKRDVTKLRPTKLYDTVIAYGLLHCLSSIVEVNKVIDLMKESLKPNGLVILAAFNNRIQIPDVQDYLQPTLLPVNYLKDIFENWEILHYEDDIITESHPTSKIEHQHSLSRIIARKF